MKKIDNQFNDLRVFRPLFPELSEPQISTLLASLWSEREKSVVNILGKSESTIKKQRMMIVKQFECSDFYAAKEIARFRINVIFFRQIFDENQKI